MPELTVLPAWSDHERAAVARDLANAIEGEVRFDLHNRMLYATDASLYQVEPLGVVIPASIEDAIRAIEFCAARSLPILPRGGGTSLAGQCTNRAVVIDFSATCLATLSINPESRTCRVEPGITVDDLNDLLASHRLFFTPDPATSRQANIGGCIGNNAAGGHSIMFGRTSESLLGVDAWIPRLGTHAWLEAGAAANDPRVRDLTLDVAQIVHDHAALIRDRFPKTIRRNAGYSLDLILQQMDSAGPSADSDAVLNAINLSHMVCGSEGTLAVTLGAWLKLHPIPVAKGLAVIGFASLEEAIDAVVPILATKPSAVELLDDTVLDLARANTEYRRYVELMPAPAGSPVKAVLYVEYFAHESAAELTGRFAALSVLLPRLAPTARMATYTDATAMLSAWKLRKAGEPLLHGTPGDRKPITFVEDNAVPVERLAEFVRRFKEIVAAHGTHAAFWAHASVGVLHVRPFLDIRDAADRHHLEQMALEVADLARSLGGVMSGEHGDGRVRGPLLEHFYGPELMRAFRRIKAAFDPKNLLNPGNIVEPGPIESIVEHLRVKPQESAVGDVGGRASSPPSPSAQGYVDTPPTRTWFDYDDQHGFRGAVEMCNGAGVCRKKKGGTMCPSYMGTLDERHSTRGRGNALRLAITGQLESIWSDPATLDTLDLCLSCKACKSECPSNVDIARLKAEYLAQGYRASGHVPLSARVFGHVRTVNHLGSIAPGLTNWLNRRGPVRAVINRALNLAPKRSLPPFARPLTSQWPRETSAQSNSPQIALFADCFTLYNEPHIGLAARRVLDAFGYRVALIDAGCCGRALISTGLLDDAVSTVDATLGRLLATPGPILFLEPSCLSAVKDDWLQLKLRTPLDARRALAARSFLVEDFLDRSWSTHPRRPDFAFSEPLILHGHCHQKALWGEDTSAAILRRLAGPDRVRTLDAGCCGMAGSFGYAAHRYELSMRIGERALFPAVRATPSAATLVAPGTSCRHQIHDGTGRRALHPVEVLAAAPHV
jgi:FAD/FMN-containing dehydrogenase/Fe-S oxidoreductase